jgi:hypothetical protein
VLFSNQGVASVIRVWAEAKGIRLIGPPEMAYCGIVRPIECTKIHEDHMRANLQIAYRSFVDDIEYAKKLNSSHLLGFE